MADFTGIDRELNSLGSVPDSLPELVSRYGVEERGDLAAVDGLLSDLGEEPSLLALGHLEEPPERSEPESGEISLGSPARRQPPNHSEPPVDGAEPESGSFQLPGVEDDGAAEDPAAAMREAMSSQLPEPPSVPSEPVSGAPPEGSYPPEARYDDVLRGAQALGGVTLTDTAAVVEDSDPEERTLVLDVASFGLDEALDKAAQVETSGSAKEGVDDSPEAMWREGAEEFQAGQTLVEEGSSPPLTPSDPAGAEFDAMFDGLTTDSDLPRSGLSDDLCADGFLASVEPTPPDVEEDLARLGRAEGEARDDPEAGAVARTRRPSSVPPSVPPGGATTRSKSVPSVDDGEIEELELDDFGDDLEILIDEDESESDSPESAPDSEERPSLMDRLWRGRKK